MVTTMVRFERVMFASASTIVLAISIVHGTPLHPHYVGHEDYDEKRECERSADCGAGRFCYKETYKCATCIDCSSRFRADGDWPCAEQASECGPCLPGYVEVSLERGVPKESCTLQVMGPELPFKDTPPPIGSENIFNFVWIFAGLGGVSLLFVASFLINHWQRGRQNSEPMQELAPLNGNANQSIDMAPPPYSSAAPPPFDVKYHEPQPTAPTLESMVEVDTPRNCHTNITLETHPRVQPARVEEQYVQAVGFRPPGWVDISGYTGENSPPPSPIEENHPDDNLADTLNDQSTQESEWTP
ncbi:Arrestin domain containing [Nesidiocoris tenuis]|uniref:Arrestin domain containing n=1 Tax=Nesidiocoris tenuis TaxID=355587 RepID=A0ABN7B3L7_9HEMI|nr:Arrestin domain containing [Nesidiocoris tenuis]